MGVGDGVLAEAVLRLYPRTIVVGIDVAPRVESRDRLTVISGDVLNLQFEQRFSGIVSNPPYQRLLHLQEQRESLRENFAAARGNFDLWFAFVERALELLAPGAKAAFLIPSGISNRPSASRLRELLDKYSKWFAEDVTEAPFREDVNLKAQLLLIERNGSPWVAGAPLESAMYTHSSRVSVGVATGSNRIFVRPVDDSWVNCLPPALVRPVIGGRDIGTNRSRNHSERRIVFPYQILGGSVKPLTRDEAPMFERFCQENEAAFGARAKELGYYIQCPLLAVAGEARVVVPEIFAKPRAAVIPRETVVLNSAFVIDLGAAAANESFADWLQQPAGTKALDAASRPLQGNYRRITVTGLNDVVGVFDDRA